MVQPLIPDFKVSIIGAQVKGKLEPAVGIEPTTC
jgi:hypothetical protein